MFPFQHCQGNRTMQTAKRIPVYICLSIFLTGFTGNDSRKSIPDVYLTLEQINQEIDVLHHRYPDRVHVEVIGKSVCAC